jgi:hypothetical protein
MLDILVISLISWWVMSSNSSFVRSYPNSSKLKKELNALFIYHFFFVCFFTYYIINFGGDSLAYWNFEMQQIHVTSDNMFDYYGISTTFLLFLNYIPSKILGLSYFTGNFLYGCLGFLGFRYLYILFRDSLSINVRLLGFKVIPFLFYLPNLHFWSAGIGKDTLCFFGIAWFLYGLYNYKKRYITLMLSLLLVYHVRPHMAVLMLAGAGVAIVLTNKVMPVFKVLFIITVLLAFYLVYDKILAFLKIEDLSVASLEELANNRVGVLNRQRVGSGFDLASYSIPVRFFTYLYRPLFFDAHNIASIFSSVENAIYLVITFFGVKNFKPKYVKKMPVWMKAAFLIFLMSVVIFANSLSNLGIIMRMKNMTMVYMLITAGWFINRRRFADLHQKRIAREKKATKSKQIMV